MKSILFVHFFLIINCAFCLEQNDSLRGLQNDIYLHPADGFTAYTLKKNEFVYNQSPFTLPLPSWAWWGITDKITCEIDLLPLLGGFFIEPHLPVPSLNFRFKLFDQDRWKPTIAFETMYQHLWRTQNQLDNPNLIIERQSGNSWYNRFNFSWEVKRKLHIHFSAGMTYTENLFIANKDSIQYKSRFFKCTFNPDISMSFDWRPKPWISFHLTTSYGTTFVYLDNIPRKYEICYGFRVAPFYGLKWKILNSFRMEFAAFRFDFTDVNASVQSLIPLFPYLYWQWTCEHKKKNSKKIN